jgi:hypothetical protein
MAVAPKLKKNNLAPIRLQLLLSEANNERQCKCAAYNRCLVLRCTTFPREEPTDGSRPGPLRPARTYCPSGATFGGKETVNKVATQDSTSHDNTMWV